VGHGEGMGQLPKVHGVHDRGHREAVLVVAGGQAAVPRGLYTQTGHFSNPSCVSSCLY
jgi:hypothetical protein